MLVFIHLIKIARNNPQNTTHKESNKVRTALTEVSSIYRKRLINSKQALITYRLENNQWFCRWNKISKDIRILGFLTKNHLYLLSKKYLKKKKGLVIAAHL